ncbi:5'-3' exoribonuclease 3-like isoform X1 [Populus alba x Populus x berolinensis]|nr:5'-3' exoribonuclease 3-like isoform X1 [Populus alba x Populus x berolinensis]
MGHLAADCEGKVKRKASEFDEKGNDVAVPKNHTREYLEYEFRIPNPPFVIVLERIVDDFIFICFFVGNDFLPHMPTLEIHEGAINLLMAVYKKEFRPNLNRVEHFIQAVGSYEDKIFQKRARLHQRQAERIKREKAQARRGDDAEPQNQPESLVAVARFHGSRLASAPTPSPYQDDGTHSQTSDGKGSSVRRHKVARLSSTANIGAAIVEPENSLEIEVCFPPSGEVHENKEELKTKLKELLREKSDVFNSKNHGEDKSNWENQVGRKDIMNRSFLQKLWRKWKIYGEMLFYPYHYAPFASDLKDLGQLDISFELGSPFKPFNQLLGVFPAASSHALPVHYRKLMTDPNSPIIDFYPTDFEVDMNGKRYAWQGIAKLPFIDESRLLAEVQKIEHTLTEEEARRNSMMFDMLFVSSSHSLSESMYLLDNHCKQLTDKERAEVKERINPELSDGMNGYLSPCAGDTHPPIVRSPVASMEDILANEVICVIYGLPDPHTHITCPPAGVIFPKKTVDQGDLKPEPILWHEDSGRRPWENDRRNPPGTISAHHLGEASHRLVSNSLQQKIDRNGYGNHMHTPPPPYFAAPCGPPHSFYSNGLHNHGHYGTLQPEIDYSHAGYPRSASPHMPTHYDRGFGSAGANPSYRRSRPQNERENQMSGPHPRQVYHPPEFHQNGRPRHPHGPVARASTGNSTFAYQGGFDASYQSYQSPGDGSHQQWGGRFPPPANHSNPSGNQFSALDHRGNKMPPQHGVANRRPQPPPGSANRRPCPPAGYGRQ